MSEATLVGDQGRSVRAGGVEVVMSQELVRREGPDRSRQSLVLGSPGEASMGRHFERVVLFSVQQEAK